MRSLSVLNNMQVSSAPENKCVFLVLTSLSTYVLSQPARRGSLSHLATWFNLRLTTAIWMWIILKGIALTSLPSAMSKENSLTPPNLVFSI